MKELLEQMRKIRKSHEKTERQLDALVVRAAAKLEETKKFAEADKKGELV